MGCLRVGVEVEATREALSATAATLPWMAPERIALGDGRFLVLLATSWSDAGEACASAERRVLKSTIAMGLGVRVLSSEAFPMPDFGTESPDDRVSDRGRG